MASMTAGRVLEIKGNSQVFSVLESTPLAELVREACRRNIGAVLVTGATGQLCGIVSERDIMRQCERQADFQRVTAGEVMTRDLATVRMEDDIDTVMDLMISRKIRHLPVLAGAQVAGVITVRDLLFAMRRADHEELQRFVEYLQSTLNERERSKHSA